jgi:hypothetical protein
MLEHCLFASSCNYINLLHVTDTSVFDGASSLMLHETSNEAYRRELQSPCQALSHMVGKVDQYEEAIVACCFRPEICYSAQFICMSTLWRAQVARKRELRLDEAKK